MTAETQQMSMEARQVLDTLRQKATTESNGFFVWETHEGDVYKLLAGELSMSSSQVKNHIGELRQQGIVELDQPAPGQPSRIKIKKEAANQAFVEPLSSASTDAMSQQEMTAEIKRLTGRVQELESRAEELDSLMTPVRYIRRSSNRIIDQAKKARQSRVLSRQ